MAQVLFKVKSEKSKVDSLNFLTNILSIFVKNTCGGTRPAVKNPGLSGASVKQNIVKVKHCFTWPKIVAIYIFFVDSTVGIRGGKSALSSIRQIRRQ